MTRVPPQPNSEPEDNADIAPPLGATLSRLARGGDLDLLRRTVALLCQERDQGHVCVALRDWQQRALAPGLEPFPPLADWQRELAATGLCNGGSSLEPRVPLVLDRSGRLYLLRHHRTEQRVLQFLQERVARPPAITAGALRQTLQELDLLPESAAQWAPGSEPDCFFDSSLARFWSFGLFDGADVFFSMAIGEFCKSFLCSGVHLKLTGKIGRYFYLSRSSIVLQGDSHFLAGRETSRLAMLGREWEHVIAGVGSDGAAVGVTVDGDRDWHTLALAKA